MSMITVAEAAENWGISVQLVRRYCREKRIPEAVMYDGIWFIPDDAPHPDREESEPAAMPPLLRRLHRQRSSGYADLYNYLQINMSYSSNRMSSNRLTRNHVEYLFKKGKILATNENMKLNDFIEVRNHFLCVDSVLAEAMKKLKPAMFLKWHSTLFSDTCGHKFKPIKAGVYRTGGVPFKTGAKIPASEISTNLTAMCQEYEKLRTVTLQDILELHVQFENIHPFDDGNGRIGRLLMLKECLRHGITPFILDDKRRSAYLDGIRCWEKDPLPLMQVCMEAQSRFQAQIELEKLLEAQARILRRLQKSGNKD